MAKTDSLHVTIPKGLTPQIKEEMKATGRTKSGLVSWILSLYFDKKKGNNGE